ncbi:transposase [Nonomuraea jabiensis]|uniref:transposase n=1 Tax=Nonomuraea jabiensis TaxID=882448 RepID=UPI003D75CECC
MALVTAAVLALTWLAPAGAGFGPRPDAAALYLSDPARTLASVAQDLGISRETLRNWVRQAQTDGTAGAKQTGPAKKPASGIRRAEVAVVQCLGRLGAAWPRNGRAPDRVPWPGSRTALRTRPADRGQLFASPGH